jgi:hypothetical protein
LGFGEDGLEVGLWVGGLHLGELLLLKAHLRGCGFSKEDLGAKMGSNAKYKDLTKK